MRFSSRFTASHAFRRPDGRAGGTRTPNRRFWRPVLYQLSYCPWHDEHPPRAWATAPRGKQTLAPAQVGTPGGWPLWGKATKAARTGVVAERLAGLLVQGV